VLLEVVPALPNAGMVLLEKARKVHEASPL
jgi:hypothetical protein